MNPLLLHTTNWNDYSLIDSGNGRKLERFGQYLFSRPEPQAFWPQRLSPLVWKKSAGTFITSSTIYNEEVKGKWSIKKNIPDRWQLSFDNLKFYATPTPFRHLGFFPDQSPHWLWAAKKNIFLQNSYK